MVRLDARGVGDQTGSRDRFVDTDTGLTHCGKNTDTHRHRHTLPPPRTHTPTVDLRYGGVMTSGPSDGFEAGLWSLSEVFFLFHGAPMLFLSVPSWLSTV